MSMEPTSEITQTLPEDSTPRSSTNTGSLSVTCTFDVNHNDLKQSLMHKVRQSVLDEYLLCLFQMVQKKDRKLRHVAPALKSLLEFSAKWQDGALLEGQMTPHHIICQAKCDNHELLDLIIACFGRSLINSKSYDGSTALLHAVKNANLKCAKSLIANGANVNLEDASYPCYSSLSSSQHTLSLW